VEIYLSRVRLDTRLPAARQALLDVHACHQGIMQAYPDGLGAGARARLRVLWREESVTPPLLLVQSGVEPDAEVLRAALGAADVQVKRIDERLRAVIEPGSRWVFRLVANATRKIDTRSSPDGSRRHGRRVPLRRETDRLSWLERRLDVAGAELVEAGGVPDVEIRGPLHRTGRRGQGVITLEGLDYRGQLLVRDPERFVRSVAEGIGPAKAYGFGLLTLAALRQP
jgi:CRISPR system Cascade subunit CasE